MDISNLINILIGGGILAFLEFLIKRHDAKHDKLKVVTDAISSLSESVTERFNALDTKIDKVEDKADQYNAVTCRVRILRFEDELQAKMKHSKDAWDQVMSGDIDEYESYCRQHPEFKNNMTATTIEHIKHGYMERLEKHDWSY